MNHWTKKKRNRLLNNNGGFGEGLLQGEDVSLKLFIPTIPCKHLLKMIIHAGTERLTETAQLIEIPV